MKNKFLVASIILILFFIVVAVSVKKTDLSPPRAESLKEKCYCPVDSLIGTVDPLGGIISSWDVQNGSEITVDCPKQTSICSNVQCTVKRKVSGSLFNINCKA